MTESTKIEFRHRRITQVTDFTEFVEMFYPGNQNQQHAAARILWELKWSQHLVPALSRCPPPAVGQVTPLLGFCSVALFARRCVRGMVMEPSRITSVDPSSQ